MKVTLKREPTKVTQRDKSNFLSTMPGARIFILHMFTSRSKYLLKSRINGKKTSSLRMEDESL